MNILRRMIEYMKENREMILSYDSKMLEFWSVDRRQGNEITLMKIEIDRIKDRLDHIDEVINEMKNLDAEDLEEKVTEIAEEMKNK